MAVVPNLAILRILGGLEQKYLDDQAANTVSKKEQWPGRVLSSLAGMFPTSWGRRPAYQPLTDLHHMLHEIVSQ